MREAEKLVNAGVKELLIISQDTSAYGVDLKYKNCTWRGVEYQTRLLDLVKALSTLDVWVRFHYVYPYPHVDKVIPLMGKAGILPYLDVPFQHASDRILKLMKRPANNAKTLDSIKKWRDLCPTLVIRSTFIVGFPGETNEEFEDLLEFLREARLNRVGCFAYSDVDGADANALEKQVPENIKQDRLERFMALQESISAELLQERIGNVEMVIIDSVDYIDDLVIARSKYDAPEVDGIVAIENIKSIDDLSPGQIIKVKIIDADGHDCVGRLVSQ
jgi:ribosomal protein S12 methylthiotransferase